MVVTLIGKLLAKENLEFVYNGAPKECYVCNLKGGCLNLEKGKRYRIIKIRDMIHKCILHENYAVVIEVEKI